MFLCLTKPLSINFSYTSIFEISNACEHSQTNREQIDNPIQSGYSSTRHIQLSFQISARPLIGQQPADRLRVQSS